jgi:hypothetical protein
LMVKLDMDDLRSLIVTSTEKPTPRLGWFSRSAHASSQAQISL